MSLNEKYTWKQFLKENPELKEKGIKRTSADGEKAFKSAYKTKVKGYLTEREKVIAKMLERAIEKKVQLTEKVKAFQQKKDWPKTNIYQQKVGKQDAAINRWNKELKRNEIKRKAL